MGVVTTSYSLLQKVKNVWSSKTLSTIALIITLFMSLNTFNAYAVTVDDFANIKYDPQKNFQDIDALEGTAVGDTGSNAQKSNGGIPYLAGMNSIIFGLYPSVLSTYAEIENNPKISPLAKAGLLGAVNNGIVAIYDNPPAVDMGRHFAKEWVPGANTQDYASYAANDGYSFLTEIGIDSLWEKSRLLAYVFFVVILIVAGFMIMFRQKIGGQLAITIYNTLPNVVWGLVLVTFSFAIVGLVLNIGVMFINVVGSFLDPSGADLVSINSPFSLVTILFKPSTVGGTITGGLAVLAPVLIGVIVAIIASGGTAAVPALLTGGIVIAIVILIVLGLLIYASVKVYITLLVAYLGIILDTVIGPLYIVLGSVPGQSRIQSDWFKRVLRNALVFPVVFFFINLGLFILKFDFELGFPSGLTGGSFASADTDGSLVGILLKAALTLVCFFLAAEAPKFLSDFIVTGGGKGTAEALGGVQKSFSKIPIIGGFFG